MVKGGEPDSVAVAIARVKTSMEAVNKGMSQRVECFEKELVEPLDALQRQYKGEGQEHLKEGTAFWNGLHADRTHMLFAKENYHQQVVTLQSILNQLS